MNLDDDANISKDEFMKAMASLGLEGKEVENLFRRSRQRQTLMQNV